MTVNRLSWLVLTSVRLELYPAYAGDAVAGVLHQTAATQPELGPDVGPLALSVRLSAPDILRATITDAASSRWEVPPSLFGALPGGLPPLTWDMLLLGLAAT